jgi:response regulator RpfG family c-di-GMP phosphodiesterase
MITAATDLDRVVRCTELGAEDYLPKPFNPVLLRARVAACLDRKRLDDREAGHLAEIEVQRRRTDELLHAVLPGPAVGELKATRVVERRRYEDVAARLAAHGASSGVHLSPAAWERVRGRVEVSSLGLIPIKR